MDFYIPGVTLSIIVSFCLNKYQKSVSEGIRLLNEDLVEASKFVDSALSPLVTEGNVLVATLIHQPIRSLPLPNNYRGPGDISFRLHSSKKLPLAETAALDNLVQQLNNCNAMKLPTMVVWICSAISWSCLPMGLLCSLEIIAPWIFFISLLISIMVLGFRTIWDSVSAVIYRIGSTLDLWRRTYGSSVVVICSNIIPPEHWRPEGGRTFTWEVEVIVYFGKFSIPSLAGLNPSFERIGKHWPAATKLLSLDGSPASESRDNHHIQH